MTEKDLTGITDLQAEHEASLGPTEELPSVTELPSTEELPLVTELQSIDELSVTAPPPEPLPIIPAPSTLDNIREFAEKISVGTRLPVPAYPFTLSIEGELTQFERAKLLDLLNKAETGIREADLEPQFEAERVIIPHISEYLGVLIIQALFSSATKIRLAPSGHDDDLSTWPAGTGAEQTRAEIIPPPSLPKAEEIPLLAPSELHNPKSVQLLGLVSASATLQTTALEAERSTEFQQMLEALQRELRFKAFRKGADLVVDFALSLTPLGTPTYFKLTVLGNAAVRTKD